MSRAEYMRNYRAKRKMVIQPITAVPVEELAQLQRRNAELTAEVRHLKAELAKRSVALEYGEELLRADARGEDLAELVTRHGSFGHSRPAPKPGKH